MKIKEISNIHYTDLVTTYIVNPEVLTEIADKIYTPDFFQAIEQKILAYFNGEINNLITKVLVYPFPVYDSLEQNDNITPVGSVNFLGTEVTSLRTFGRLDNMKPKIIDLGSIKINKYYFNSADYIDTIYKLWLPYYDFIDLPSNLCVDKSVHVKLYLDISTGRGTYYVSNSDDIIITKIETDIAVEIPITHSNIRDTIVDNTKSIMSGVVGTAVGSIVGGVAGGIAGAGAGLASLKTHEVLTSAFTGSFAKFTSYNQIYVQVIRPALKSNNFNLKGYPDNEYRVLGDIKGYAEFKEVRLDEMERISTTAITEIERELIKQKLIGGVYL